MAPNPLRNEGGGRPESPRSESDPQPLNAVAAARSQWEATQERVPQARAALLPTVSAQGAANLNNYDPEMHESARRQLAIESDLRRAVTERHLTLVFQPIVTETDCPDFA